MTNADRIRKMTDEELGELLDDVSDRFCSYCELDERDCATNDCRPYMTAWLKQEASDGLRKIDIIRALGTTNKDAELSCIIVCKGEVFAYEASEVNGAKMLELAKAAKRGAKFHITG